MPPLLHSILGASKSRRWMNCPGSVRMCASMPNKSSIYADEGTAAHFLGEQCLRQNKDAEEFVEQMIGLPDEGEPSFLPPNASESDVDPFRATFTVDDAMAEAVQVYLDEIRTIMDKYPGAELRIEHKFHLAGLHEDLWGTCDAVIVVPFHKVIVLDYKHGRGVAVSAEENTQGMLYALGAAWGEDLEDIEIVIVQPNSGRREGGVKRWSTTRTELMKWGKEVLLPAALATEKPDAPLKFGPWCKDNFCEAAGVCPAQRQMVMEAAQVAFDDGMFPVEQVPALPAYEVMTEEELTKSLALADLVEPWFKGLWSYAHAQLMQGRFVPGFKIVRGKPGNRKYVNEEKALNKLFTVLKQDAYERPKLKPPAQAEKTLKALAKEGKLHDLKDAKAVAEFMNSLTTRAEGRLQMVPESDPRPAVNMLPEAVFDGEFTPNPIEVPEVQVCSAEDF